MTDRLILASGSPRRTELLTMLGIDHDVMPVNVEEVRKPGEEPDHYVSRLALDKARAGAARDDGRWVLGADTTVALRGDVLEKPGSVREAEEMLTMLAGDTHRVYSAVALVGPGGEFTDLDVTEVRFRPMMSEEIREYVATGEPMDKAGAYGIQGRGAAFVERINGDYFGVMGLPVVKVVRLLERAGRPYHFTR